MASEEILDFEALLAYIPGENNVGPELKEDPELSATYYEIKDAREAARTAERQLQMAWGEEEELEAVEPPDWRRVEELAIDILTTKSKDLWVAAWLTEALCRQHGFAGLRDGFRLTRELIYWFWDGIHPVPDEDGVATTVAQLAGLNGEDADGALIAPIRNIPITAEGTHPPLSNSDYLQAVSLSQATDPDARQARIDQGAFTTDMFDAAVRETSAEFFQNLVQDMEQAIDEFGQLTAMMDEKCGEDESGYPQAPPTSTIQATLEECLDRVKSVARDILAVADANAADEGVEGELMTVDGDGGEVATGQRGLQTREDAFRALLQVADFFRQTEPHSIVSYSLNQVVRWGRMSLPELLKELIGDDTSRNDMFKRVGIQTDEEAAAESSDDSWS